MGEFAQAGDAAGEEAGVDRASDPWGRLDGGHDGQPGDLAHVPGREAAPFLGDEDDPVDRACARGQQRGQREVAGASEDDVALGVLVAEPWAGVGVQTTVDDDRVGSGDRRWFCQGEVSSHGDRLGILDGREAEQGRSALVQGCG